MGLRLLCGMAAVLTVASFGSAAAQTPTQAPPRDPDLGINLAQPDFTLVGLPTTLRVPKFKSAFRVTHRFTRPLGDGGLGDLASDLFGLDAGSQIGLEYRFGILPRTQIGIHRTSDRTIELFAQRNLMSRGGRIPLTVDVIGTAEGTNNFRDSYSPGVGAVVSWTIPSRAGFYLEPMWVNNTNSFPSELVDHNSTATIGIGTRVRVRPSVYLTFEASPRVAGYDPGVTQISFGFEKRIGGHLFQMNFSNGFGTTLAQIARGGASHDDWYMGFNISRKFY